MKNKCNDAPPEPVANRIRSLSHNELVSVLRRRKQYQPEAVSAAVEEAIRRGIIQTEEDLFSDEFEEPEQKFTFFPCPGNDYSRVKLFRSLLRVVMIAGVIPVVYGLMKFPMQKYVEGVALVSLGAVWIALAWFVMERHEKRLILPMGILALLSVVYTGRILLLFKYPEWSDFLVPAVLFGFIFYFLFYARSLMGRSFPDGK